MKEMDFDPEALMEKVKALVMAVDELKAALPEGLGEPSEEAMDEEGDEAPDAEPMKAVEIEVAEKPMSDVRKAAAMAATKRLL